ncbi:Peptidyl-prolyl cis-trans isomerase B [Roseibaca ekhonensis]|jgi:peptidylprolyl isomerase|uniref:Peptidyl-prolyl cis-trans isomerase n=1 Tax=Roseinatronobacter ekhonensis TaxID=254356 RepID=A0A3B0M2T8_9RHOB|nr:peptidylprolyl isomerase [Roseibaca ekhonensis]SUZ30472.1 Peptidyl-prolyl cis-trans isomerase B [Roseibaca ekhonensis]
MRDKLIFAGLFAAGLAILGASWWNLNSVSAQTTVPEEHDGPVMVIEVAGEANGVIRIALRDDLAPNHVERIVTLAENGSYDGVVFHRVIEGFMAQTGDVEHGRSDSNSRFWGMGGSDLPDLRSEFTDETFARGVVGMARSQNPHSANSQFFIMFAPAPHLNGQYTVVGQMIDGYDVLDNIKRGTGGNGAVVGTPDRMANVTIEK